MKVIQVGIGGMGETWLRAVQRSAEVDYAGFVEINDAIARQQAAAYNLDPATIFTSLPAALEKLDADAIIDVTPPQFHRANSTLALEAGLPVLSEKPLAGALEDAQAIVDKARETGLSHMVAQNYRYRPVTQTIKSLLETGELGAVGAVHAEFFKGPHFGGFREEMPHPLIIDMAIHHFDMMRYFLGSDVQEISARSWNPPWSWFKGDASAAASMRFENGVFASYSASWCSQALPTSWNADWRFDCEKGVMLVKDDVVTVQDLLRVTDSRGALANAHGERRVIPLLEMEREGQDYLLREFFAAVTKGKPVATSAQDNIRTIEFVFGVVQACDSGETVKLS
ncbi:MAG: Gfo/Idh/MocA family oxidoreductase [Chloroflexota bacterium]|nr:Gfo/Idh/MocA family oxidoreductase [Chloroflexota bacterium]